MLSLQRQVRDVNATVDQSCPLERDCQSRYGQLRRVLALIDLMAPLRRAHSTHELHGLLNEKTGSQWHFRTVTRDLVMLADQGLVDRETRADFAPCSTRTAMWKLNLQPSEPAQEAAIKVLDAEHDPNGSQWNCILHNCETGDCKVVCRGLTKYEALLRVRYWKVRKTNCVLVPWPEWIPVPGEFRMA